MIPDTQNNLISPPFSSYCDILWPITLTDMLQPAGHHFFMNCQAAVLLDDFTTENGGTGIIPGSQKEAKWPDRDAFYKTCIQAEGKVGQGMVWYVMVGYGMVCQQ